MRNIFKLKLLFTVLLFAAPAHAQQVVPAYSSKRVDALAKAIGLAEGFHVKGSKPARLHNPGDLKQVDKYRHFRNDAEGWQALREQLVRVIAGQSKHYTLQMTFQQMGRSYAGAPVWAHNVAKYLDVPVTTKLETFLCDGDLDVPPVVVY